MHITITKQDRKTMSELAARWTRDYAAADADQRAEMIEHAAEVYEGMDYSNSLIGAVRQGFDPSPNHYAVVLGQGERGYYVCREPETGDMYVTCWDVRAETPEDLSFPELES